MITQDTSAEKVLSEPTMGPLITEWQREKIRLADVSGALRTHLVKECTDEYRSKYEIHDEAGYLAEDIDGLTDEELGGEPGSRLLPSDALEWARRERSQQRALTEAEENIVKHAETVGADDFALYGIGKYLRRPEKGLSYGDILNGAAETETRLRSVNEEVRKNAGNQIFYINPGNVTAAVLTSGGIKLDLKKDQTVFPTETNSVVGAILERDMAQIFFREDALRVDTRHVDNNIWILMDALEFLRMERLSSYRGLAFGSIPEGPLFADTGDRAHRTFLHTAGNRIRTAAQASLDPTMSLDLH